MTPRPHDEVARWIEATNDLLTHPRHSIDAKGRRWLESELRDLRREEAEGLATPGPLFACLAKATGQ